MNIRLWWRRLLGGGAHRGGGIRRLTLPVPRLSSTAMTALVAFFVAVAGILFIEMRLRPMVLDVAQIQATSRFTEVVDGVILQDLQAREAGYEDFITIERDAQGNIQGITTDMAAMNLLRAQLEDAVFQALGEVDVSTVQVALGTLVGSDFLWGRGPSVSARAISMGVMNSEFYSEFVSGGVNQTLHRIYLDIDLPLTLFVAGGTVEIYINTQLCVAETVIVGQVPSLYSGTNF